MTVKLYTVPRVKLAKVGDYPVERGFGKFTETDILSMAKYAKENHGGRLKIKHVANGPGALSIWGQTANETAEIDPVDGLLTLYGDYVNVPGPLAAQLPTRLPGRSIEATRNRKMADGSTAPMVMKYVALLGEEEPSMSTLGDHPTTEETVPEDEKAKAAAAAKAAEEKATADAKAEADKKAAEEAAAKKADDEAKAAAEAKAKLEAAGGAPTVEVDAGVFKQMQDQLTELTEAREQDVAASRSTLLDDCIADRRITEESRPAWDALLEKDPNGARDKLAGLPKWHGAPIHAERGHQGNAEQLGEISDDKFDEIYNKHYGRETAKGA